MSLFQSMLLLSSCLVVNFCSQVALLFSSYPCLSTPAVHINEQKVLKPFSLSLYLPNPFSLFLSSLCLHCCSNIKILMHHRDGWDGGIWSKKDHMPQMEIFISVICSLFVVSQTLLHLNNEKSKLFVALSQACST